MKNKQVRWAFLPQDIAVLAVIFAAGAACFLLPGEGWGGTGATVGELVDAFDAVLDGQEYHVGVGAVPGDVDVLPFCDLFLIDIECQFAHFFSFSPLISKTGAMRYYLTI